MAVSLSRTVKAKGRPSSRGVQAADRCAASAGSRTRLHQPRPVAAHLCLLHQGLRGLLPHLLDPPRYLRPPGRREHQPEPPDPAHRNPIHLCGRHNVLHRPLLSAPRRAAAAHCRAVRRRGPRAAHCAVPSGRHRRRPAQFRRCLRRPLPLQRHRAHGGNGDGHPAQRGAVGGLGAVEQRCQPRWVCGPCGLWLAQGAHRDARCRHGGVPQLLLYVP